MKHLTALWDQDLLKIEAKFCSSCNRLYGNEAVACYSCEEEKPNSKEIADAIANIKMRLDCVEKMVLEDA
jgi:hypothetical protein